MTKIILEGVLYQNNIGKIKYFVICINFTGGGFFLPEFNPKKVLG